jgi:tetratricopeptide (TPR) repeat protein
MSTTTASRRDPHLLRSLAARIDPSDAGAHNNLGVLYHSAGLFDDAVDSFSRALALDPRMDMARRNLEIASLKSGRTESRATELRAHLQRCPGDTAARWELGRGALLLGRHGEAIEQLTALLKGDPNHVGVEIQLGLAYRAADDVDAASACFERAMRRDPNSSIACLHLAEIEYNRGVNDRAIALLREALQRNPRHHEAWHLLGFALGDEGRHEEAREAAARAVELNPDLARAQPNLELSGSATARYVDLARRHGVDASPESPLTHLTLGIALRKRGYHAEAGAELQRALAKGEDRDLVEQAIAELHLLGGRAVEAESLYGAMLTRHPSSSKLWNEHGVAKHLCGDAGTALDSYRRALACDPSDALAWNNHGVAAFQGGDREDAMRSFREAVRHAPRLGKARCNLGLLLYKEGKHAEAVDAYRGAIETGHAMVGAWNGLGVVLAEIGRHEDARAAFARAIEADTRNAAAHYNMSFTLSALGDVEGAMRENGIALGLSSYYVAQRFELVMDLQFDDPDVAVSLDLGGDESTAAPVESFTFDAAALADLFGATSPGEGPQQRTADHYALARDYLSKGLHDRAHGEIARAVSAGAEASEGELLRAELFSAQHLWGEAVERYRNVRRAQPESASAVLGESRALLQLGRADEARALAEAIIHDVATDADAQLLLAAIREADNDAASALEAVAAAESLAADRPDVHIRKGEVLRRLDRPADALAAFREAVRLAPASPEMRLAIAGTLETLGDVRGAERELAFAMDAFPGHPGVAIAIGRLRRSRGAHRDAMLVLVDVLQRNPYEFSAMIDLGETLLDLQLPGEALVAFGRVLRFHPAHAPALYHEGVSLARLQRQREAVDRWRRVAQLEPTGTFGVRARRCIKELEARHSRLDLTGTGD